MPIRRLYRRVTGMYRKAGTVARHALRGIPARSARTGSAGLARIDAQRRLLDAMRELPEPYRTTIVLCRIDGRSPEAVARWLRVPAKVVRARLRHALRFLAERLEGRGA
ncbi:MAG TPA: sigma factor-like helix-turn-helix DNA-binding protein [Planctomycetota bacterium]|nr:sigma factor-like helix-turn-helix DNA-binding protein [Planctomycetota bacterium]